jgi:hypothetical protein
MNTTRTITKPIDTSDEIESLSILFCMWAIGSKAELALEPEHITPKALAKFQPRVGAHATTLGSISEMYPTLKGLTVHMPNPFRV